jgi:hypothetical protein
VTVVRSVLVGGSVVLLTVDVGFRIGAKPNDLSIP